MSTYKQIRYKEEKKHIEMLLKVARDNWLSCDERDKEIYGAEVDYLQNQLDILKNNF